MPKKKTDEQFKQEVFNLVGNEYTFLENYDGANKKLKVKHNSCDALPYDVTPSNFLRGARCTNKNCDRRGGSNKKTTKSFNKEIQELVGEEYLLLSEYKGAHKKIEMQLSQCKNGGSYTYKVTPSNFLKGSRCPKCALIKRTNEEFLKMVFDQVGVEYTFLDQYINNRTKLKVKHETCDNVYKVEPEKSLNGQRCSTCLQHFKIIKTTRKTNEQFLKEVFQLVGDEYVFLEKYDGAHSKLKIRHNICTHEYKTTPDNFINGERRCPKCNGSFVKTNEQFLNEVFQLTENEYIFLEDYINAKTHLKVHHTRCKNNYEVTPDHFLRGERCPYCSKSKRISKAEKEILKYIKTLIPKDEIIENDRILLGGKEIDIFIPSKNIGFEL